MYGPDLTDADLSHANLSDANLPFANLSGADMEGTNFQDANLDNVICDPYRARLCLVGDFTGALNVPAKYLKD
jgi:uncharacterized protein YjbI with pentapeptide repeats